MKIDKDRRNKVLVKFGYIGPYIYDPKDISKILNPENNEKYFLLFIV